MLLMCVVNYRSGASTIESLLREDTQGRATRIARKVEDTMRAHEAHLSAWANSPEVRAYLHAGPSQTPAEQDASGTPISPPNSANDGASVQENVQKKVHIPITNILNNNQKHFESLMLLDGEGHALLYLDTVRGSDGTVGVRMITKDIPESTVHVDNRVWAATQTKALRAPITYESSYGACERLTFPIFPNDDEPRREPSGALVVEVKLSALFEEISDPVTVPATSAEKVRPGADGFSNPSAANSERMVVALDNQTGNAVYRTNSASGTRPVTEVMPFFKNVAGKMTAGAMDGLELYDTPDGNSWLAAFTQVRDLNVSVAVARNYSAAGASIRRANLLSMALLLLGGVAASGLLLSIAHRATQRIERVAAGAAAIAGGDLNQRIDVRKSDETQALAESFNLMSDRLREHIAREAETKQFESFMRLSAMLTHDLKNSITGLSMLVSNMEKHSHNAEFRADAILSLREATDKLRRIVSRLNEPMKSLSGEYRRTAKETDLVPIIKRVLAVNVEPSVPLYEIETHMSEALVATVEPERIENVIENLVINALEAMSTKGGRLTVEAGMRQDGHVFFSIADTGMGMSEEFLRSRLFRPFMTTKTKGIGLGLFTCREIVETHGGRLDVESQLGVGTRFRVVLPSSLFSSRDRQKQPHKGAVATSTDGRGS